MGGKEIMRDVITIDLGGHVALVTGASQGLGAEMAHTLGAAGASNRSPRLSTWHTRITRG